MDLAYICSPYRADDPEIIRRNVAYARELTLKAINNNYTPITPHLYLTQILDDNDPRDRNLGLTVGGDLLRRCDTIIIGTRYGISPGMREEIKAAEILGLTMEVML